VVINSILYLVDLGFKYGARDRSS